MRLYLDSSALVKLVQVAAESESLRRYLRQHEDDRQVSSQLARVEVVRAVRPNGAHLVRLAQRLLRRTSLLLLHRRVLDDAAELGTRLLRSLDAIHLATALQLGDELRAVVTYDDRMRTEAEALGLPTAGPA